MHETVNNIDGWQNALIAEVKKFPMNAMLIYRGPEMPPSFLTRQK